MINCKHTYIECDCGNRENFDSGVKFSTKNPNEDQMQFLKCLDCGEEINYAEIAEQLQNLKKYTTEKKSKANRKGKQ